MSQPQVLELIKQGLELWKGGNFDGAVTSFQKAIELSPEIPHAYFYLATMLDEEKGEQAEVLRLFERFVELSTRYPKLAPQVEIAKKRIGELRAMMAHPSAVDLPQEPSISPKKVTQVSPVQPAAASQPLPSSHKRRLPWAVIAGLVILGIVALLVTCRVAAYVIGQSGSSSQRSSSPSYSSLPTPQGLIVAAEGYYPFIFLDNAGNMQGMDVEIVQEICRRIGCTPYFSVLSWDAVVSGIQEGRYGMIAGDIEYAPDRDQIMDFSISYITYSFPAGDAPIYFAFPSGSTLVGSVNSAIQSMQSDGTLNNIISHWLGQATQVPFPQPTP